MGCKMKDEKNVQIESYELPKFKRRSIIEKRPVYVIDNKGSVEFIRGTLGEKINQIYLSRQ